MERTRRIEVEKNRSGGGAESKGDNDMLQCVIINSTVLNVKAKLKAQAVFSSRSGLSSPVP